MINMLYLHVYTIAKSIRSSVYLLPHSGSVSEDINGSCMSLPASDGSPSMRVLTRHAGSRKRRTDSIKSLGGSEDYERK